MGRRSTSRRSSMGRGSNGGGSNDCFEAPLTTRRNGRSRRGLLGRSSVHVCSVVGSLARVARRCARRRVSVDIGRSGSRSLAAGAEPRRRAEARWRRRFLASGARLAANDERDE
jgi:hypothetical protein